MNARDEHYATPLHYASKYINATDLVELLLTCNADPSPHDSVNRATPLHNAAYHGALGSVVTLLKHGM